MLGTKAFLNNSGKAETFSKERWSAGSNMQRSVR
jgi:hypothetical protein